MAVTSDLRQTPSHTVAADSSSDYGGWSDAAGFVVAVSREAESVLVRPHGDLDAPTSHRLALVLASLLGNGCPSVVLDLAELEVLDSGSAWLIGEASRLFKDHGSELVVRSPRVPVLRVVDSAGLAPLVETHPEAGDIAPLPC